MGTITVIDIQMIENIANLTICITSKNQTEKVKVYNFSEYINEDNTLDVSDSSLRAQGFADWAMFSDAQRQEIFAIFEKEFKNFLVQLENVFS